jgi:hypothetical protein
MATPAEPIMSVGGGQASTASTGGIGRYATSTSASSLSLRSKPPSYMIPERKMRSVWEEFFMYLRSPAGGAHAVHDRPQPGSNATRRSKGSDDAPGGADFTLPG